MFKGGQSIQLRLYISSAFAASRRPPQVAESERGAGGFTQECVIADAGGARPIQTVGDAARQTKGVAANVKLTRVSFRVWWLTAAVVLVSLLTFCPISAWSVYGQNLAMEQVAMAMAV